MRVVVLLLLGAAAATMAGNAGLSAVVQKPSVEVHSQPDFAAPTLWARLTATDDHATS